MANYLRLHEIPKDTIENVVKSIIESPEYKGVDHGFSTFDMPEAVERALRAHLDKDIQATLYATFSEDVIIPEEKKRHVKCIPIGMGTNTPAIVITEFKEGQQHLWIATDKHERLDYDGQIYKKLAPIGGYLEINGLR